MIIDDKIRNEKLQYDINKKAAKISALSSGKIDKYILQAIKILPSNQSQIIYLSQNVEIYFKFPE